MNALVKYRPKFYMSAYRAERYSRMVNYSDQVEIKIRSMTDDFGLLFENGKILVVYFNEMEE